MAYNYQKIYSVLQYLWNIDYKIRVLLLGSKIYGRWSARIGKRPIIKAYRGGKIFLGKGFNTCRDVEVIAFEGAEVIFGDNVYIGHSSTIAAKQLINIGENTLISDIVSIRDHNHRFEKDKRPQDCGFIIEPVIIGKNCWIGSKATITAGVRLGDNVMVGANSVVTRSFGSNIVIGGCPAEIIREL